MWWVVWWNRGVQRNVEVGNGYFNCPGCKTRQPCTLSQDQTATYLFGFIPLNSAASGGPESYVCRVCEQQFRDSGMSSFDFGDHPAPRTWKCFKCKKEMPYGAMRCRQCGYELGMGGRT